jgi:hypothetical protein
MPHRPIFFLIQTLVVILVAIVHLSAMQWYLYWYFPWLDLLTHFLGGLWIALACSWGLSYVGRSISFVPLLSAVMVIGIGWEVFESMAGIPKEANFVFDSTLDLVMDFVGGTVGFVVARRLLRDGTIVTQ